MFEKAHYLFFYLIPLAGFFSNISILIVIYFMKKSRQYRFSLSLLYSGAVGFNLFQFLSFLTDSYELSMRVYYYYYTIQLLMTNGFLLFSLEFTNKNYKVVRNHMTVSLIFSLIWMVILLYSSILTDLNNLFISGIRKYDWGFYPMPGYGSYITNIYWIYVFVISYYYLFQYLKKNPKDKKGRIIILLFALITIASISNFLTLWEFQILPLGSAFDAILTPILAAIFFREQYLETQAQFFLKIAGIIAAVSFSLVVLWFFSSYILTFNKNLIFYIIFIIFITFISLIFFNTLFSPPILRNNFEKKYEILRNIYDLTHQEAMICKYISEEKKRSEILKIMNVSGNTLKVQLKSIYKKTIEREQKFQKNKNKFPILKEFLENIENL